MYISPFSTVSKSFQSSNFLDTQIENISKNIFGIILALFANF